MKVPDQEGDYPGDDLMGPGQKGDGGSHIACIVSKSSDSFTGVVGEEFDIEKEAIAAGEAGEVSFPTMLTFVAVSEVDVSMWEGDCLVVSQ